MVKSGFPRPNLIATSHKLATLKKSSVPGALRENPLSSATAADSNVARRRSCVSKRYLNRESEHLFNFFAAYLFEVIRDRELTFHTPQPGLTRRFRVF